MRTKRLLPLKKIYCIFFPLIILTRREIGDEILEKITDPWKKTECNERLEYFKSFLKEEKIERKERKEKTLTELIHESKIPVTQAKITKEFQEEMERVKRNGCAYFFKSEETDDGE